MGLYNFQQRFAGPILAGTKRHTIRACRAHPDVPGNTLHLYTGLRTRHARLLRRVPCTAVSGITIEASGRIAIDGRALGASEAGQLARLDGFADLADMLAFWREPVDLLPFRGHIIIWGQ